MRILAPFFGNQFVTAKKSWKKIEDDSWRKRKKTCSVEIQNGWGVGGKERFAMEIFGRTQNEANHFGRFFHFGKQTTALITQVELYNGVVMFFALFSWNLIYDKTFLTLLSRMSKIWNLGNWKYQSRVQLGNSCVRWIEGSCALEGKTIKF